MIRINLLPFRAARKRENIKRQITIYGLVIVLSLAVMAWAYTRQKGTLSQLKKEEEQTTKELAKFKKELDEIRSLEKKKKEISTKLNVINKLKEGKTGPVLLLSDIADAVPKGKLWLNSLSESKGNLTLVGTAMDNETIALFMNNLEKTDRITSVDLRSATLRDIAQYNLKVSDFVLDCKTYAAKKPEKKSDNKKGKKK